MCGICGIVSFRGENGKIKSQLQSMNHAIAHRGPDGEGYLTINVNNEATAYYGNETSQNIISSGLPYAPTSHLESSDQITAGFGHRRLSVIDLGPQGHQPMCDSTKSIWITYNGEIYNYLELREELKDHYSFISNSDTEVIIAAYHKWGVNCVDHFNGMWSFALIDTKNNLLFASRDRFGVKPFYYAHNSESFCFASEQKALLKSGVVKAEMNPPAIFDYFVKGELELEEEGVFKSIYELFPSHSLTLDLRTGELKKWKYYNLDYNKKFEAYTEKKADQKAEELQELLVRSIELRLRSDVEVGSCLSGGLDSSTIVGIIDKLKAKNISEGRSSSLKVFTAAFQEPNIDESKWAKLVVDNTKAKWLKTTPSETELFHDLNSLIYAQDEPIWSTSTYAQHRVMRLAKEENIKVLLDGQGGDELFAGYESQLPSYWNEMALNFDWNNLRKDLKSYKGLSFYISQLKRQQFFSMLPANLQYKLYLKHRPELEFLNRDFWETYKHRVLDLENKAYGTLNKKLHSEFFNSRLKVYLKCEDRCSMWHSVESRTPFADDLPLIEYMFQTPGNFKIHRGITKALMRKAISPFVPKEILERKDKMGYVTPNFNWIKELSGKLKENYEEKDDFLNMTKLRSNYEFFFSSNVPRMNGELFKYQCYPIWKSLFFK